MKVAKLVAGILCEILAVVILFQSCAAGLVDAIENQGGTSGGAGLIVAFLMIAGGIVMIATRKGGKGGSIACLILFVIAAIVGFSGAGVFKDLNIWAGLCAVLAVLNLISLFTGKKPVKTEA